MDHQEVRDCYDRDAGLYASLFLDELSRDRQSLLMIDRFAAIASPLDGLVVDVGCGPGYLVNHLCELGLNAVGYDLSAGQIAEARKAFPERDFDIGDLANLDAEDGTLAGITARHSIIHTTPSTFERVFLEWNRSLVQGAPIFLSFYGSLSASEHGMPFDHKVVTAHQLFPEVLADQLRDTGFTNIENETTPIPEGGRPFNHVTMLAIKR